MKGHFRDKGCEGTRGQRDTYIYVCPFVLSPCPVSCPFGLRPNGLLTLRVLPVEPPPRRGLAREFARR